MKNKLVCVLVFLIIVGAIVYKVKGFNKELNYSNRQEFKFSAASTFEISKVESIAKEIVLNRPVKVLKVERFDNALEIVSKDISEEEKQNIINKVNEEYNENISSENVNIISINETRIIDILKPYILPLIITFSAVLLYFIFVYRRLGVKKVLIEGIVTPTVLILSYYAIIAIVRVPFGRITNSIAVGIYLLSIGALAMCFQNEKEKLNIINEKENDE